MKITISKKGLLDEMQQVYTNTEDSLKTVHSHIRLLKEIKGTVLRSYKDVSVILISTLKEIENCQDAIIVSMEEK